MTWKKSLLLITATAAFSTWWIIPINLNMPLFGRSSPYGPWMKYTTNTAPSQAYAHVSKGVLFTCAGKLSGPDNEYYVIAEDQRDDPDYFPMVCGFEKNSGVSRQILRICKVGDYCTVSAKGKSHNRNEHVIQKVFEVQKGL